MNQLTSCSSCGGFLPSPKAACPHCGRKSKIKRIVKGVVGAAVGGTVAITLMACYGPPIRPTTSGPAPSGTLPEPEADAGPK